jgi:hypothetical protein
MEIVGHVLESHPERVRAAAAASALVDVADTVTAARTLEQPPLLIRESLEMFLNERGFGSGPNGP